MGGQSPGHSSNHEMDTSMKIKVKDLLSNEHKEVIESLHQITPAHGKILKDIEKRLVELSKEYQDDQDLVRGIEILYYKVRNYQLKKTAYNEKDNGPFTVIVEKSKASEGRGLHPVDLGKKMFALKINNINKISKKGFNRIGITFSSYVDANNLLYNEQLMRDGYKAYIPQRFLTNKGIVKNVGHSIVEEDFINEAQTNVRILEARRLNRRVMSPNGEVNYVPSMTFLITFEGRRKPNEIFLYAYPIKVENYVIPISQCKKCLRFGHSFGQCRSKIRCAGCGLEEHTLEGCLNNIKCVYCHGDHLATNKECKEFERQRKINELMGFHDYSYYEANQIIPPLVQKKKTGEFIRTPQAFPVLQESTLPATIMYPKTPTSYSQFKPISQTKRRKHTTVERNANDTVELRNAQVPQPTRTASPNGNVLMYFSQRPSSPFQSNYSSPSPSFSSLSPINSAQQTTRNHSVPNTFIKQDSEPILNVSSDKYSYSKILQTNQDTIHK